MLGDFQKIEHLLVQGQQWEDIMVDLLEAIGVTFNGKRVSLFHVEVAPHSKATLGSLAFEWASQQDSRRFQDATFQSIPMQSNAWVGLLAQLGSRQTVTIEDASAAVEPYLSVQLGMSLVFPIVAEEKLWGFVVIEGDMRDHAERMALKQVIERLESRIIQEQIAEAATKLERSLRLIETIVADAALDNRAKIEQLLAVGIGAFDLEVAIVSNIVGQSYTVKHFWPPDSGLQHEQVFELGQTYCSITLRLGAVVGIPYVQESPYRNHPCYQVFQLVSYFGVQLRVGGKYYGTVNFSSPTPRKQPFTDSDRRIIRKLADEIGLLL